MYQTIAIDDLKSPGGLFVVLYDRNTLDLYLKEGTYGFLMSPLSGNPSPQSAHYRALADYACAREGTHVFFFLQRTIVYAGQIIGNSDSGAFYINGQTSPLGREASANLYWDESPRYERTDEAGIFIVKDNEGKSLRRAQPFLIRFADTLNLSRREISSDDLYFELGSYPYPLPSNSIQGMGFCTLTPGETSIALRLLTSSDKGIQPYLMQHRVSKESFITSFTPKLGIQDLQLAYHNDALINESHLEFSIIANPQLLPPEIRPTNSDVICRQVPISPFKPSNMDRADICYYDTNDMIRDGTLPNRILELKKNPGTRAAIEQVERYLRWLKKISANPKDFSKVAVYIFAPSYLKNVFNYRSEFKGQISLVDFAGDIHRL